MKTQYVYSRTSNRLTPLLGSVASERGLDVLMILLMAICLMASHPRLEALIKREELALVVSLVLVCGLLVIFARRVLLGWLPERIRRSVEDFISVLTDVRAVSLAGSITLLLFISYAVRFHLVLTGMHVQPDLPLLGLLLVATAAGFLIPAAPGAIGTYHAAVVYVLVSIHGMEKTTAQLCAIYLHITSYLPSTLVGFVIFLLSGTRFEKQHSAQDSSR